jgi:hypothetical protein
MNLYLVDINLCVISTNNIVNVFTEPKKYVQTMLVIHVDFSLQTLFCIITNVFPRYLSTN